MGISVLKSYKHYIESENPYWISISDIMAGLLIIFILATLSLILELTETKSEVQTAIIELAKAEDTRRDIILEIEEKLLSKNIKIEVSDNHTIIRIPDNILAFESNQYRVPNDPSTRYVLTEIGKELYNAISKEERWQYLDTIFIEGHTDHLKSTRRMGNWGLSTFRAISVWEFWNNKAPKGKKLSGLRNHVSVPLFSVSGYGKTRSIHPRQKTEADLKRNRRIDIRFTVKRPSLAEFKNIKTILEDR